MACSSSTGAWVVLPFEVYKPDATEKIEPEAKKTLGSDLENSDESHVCDQVVPVWNEPEWTRGNPVYKNSLQLQNTAESFRLNRTKVYVRRQSFNLQGHGTWEKRLRYAILGAIGSRLLGGLLGRVCRRLQSSDASKLASRR